MLKHISIFAVSLSLMACSAVNNGSNNLNDPPENYQSSGVAPQDAFPTKRAASSKRTFIFSPKDMAWAAYDKEGNRVRTGLASGGSYACPETGNDCRTVRGNFHVISKGDEDCKSGKYPLGEGGAPMAYCMRFYKGYAIHGGNGTPNAHHSHGCIHVTEQAAKWLNEDFLNIGSNVIVGPY